MNRPARPLLAPVTAALCVVLAAGAATAQPTPDEAQARLEAAKAALEAAQAEMAAAEEALKAANAASPELAVKQGFLQGWDGSVEAGVTGATGNSENFNFRIALNAERLNERMETRFDASYRFATSDGEDTANRFETGLRNDWLFHESPWRIFAQARYEYDDFQDWDHRLSGFAGVGYEFVKTDTTSLVGRAGLGGSLTAGGDDDGFTPEGLLALDFTHKFDEAQEIALGTEFLPSLDPVGDYRVNSFAEYKVMVNPENDLFLRTGIKHRYDSNPGDANRSDLEYFLTLGWGF